MDEDISIINTNTRNEKIKNFFVQNKKKIFAIILAVIISILAFFAFGEYKGKKIKKIDIFLQVCNFLSHDAWDCRMACLYSE